MQESATEQAGEQEQQEMRIEIAIHEGPESEGDVGARHRGQAEDRQPADEQNRLDGVDHVREVLRVLPSLCKDS